MKKWFDKPGSDDWVVVGVGEVGALVVGEVGALVVPTAEVPYHMTMCTFQEVLEETKTYPDLCR